MAERFTTFKAWRLGMGFSQTDTAYELGISDATVKRYDRGIARPNSTVLKLMFQKAVGLVGEKHFYDEEWPLDERLSPALQRWLKKALDALNERTVLTEPIPMVWTGHSEPGKATGAPQPVQDDQVKETGAQRSVQPDQITATSPPRPVQDDQVRVTPPEGIMVTGPEPQERKWISRILWN